MRSITDPVELIVADALDNAGISYSHESTLNSRAGAVGLDFYLTDFDVFIECKQFHTPRIEAQMARAENVIVIQGVRAALFFARRISGKVEAV